MLVASEDALDQFFMREPEALLGRRVEAAISTTRTRASSTRTSSPPPSRGRSRTRTRRRSGPRRSSARRSCRSWSARRPGTCGRDATTRPGACLAPLGRHGVVHDRRRGDRLGPRPRGARARLLDRARGRDLPAPRRAVPRARARSGRAAGRSSRPIAVDWYTQAKKETETAIEEPLRVRDHARGRAPLRPRLRHRAGDRVPEEGDRGRLHARRRARCCCRRRRSRPRRSGSRPGADLLGRSRRRCRSCSARCTRPSTR